MITNTVGNSTTGSARGKAFAILFLVFLVLLSVSFCGCIKLMQQATENNHTQTADALNRDTVKNVVTGDPITPGQTDPILQQTVSVTVPTPDFVSDASPILPPDPYPVQHAMRINETLLTNRYARYIEFSRTYVLRGNSTGLFVNASVLERPLWISFTVNPLYDCLDNPESCRGEPGTSISRPFFTLTVRDNQTHEIVAEDGYGREYSSAKDSRTIFIYREGRYHLTLTGNSVDVTLAVATGATPAMPVTQPSPAGPAPTKALPPEYLRYLRQPAGAA